ncbi:hypothetical protein VIGAN_04094800 [Vigna angularis var. angularis]|uniref:CI111 double-psi beta barrel domain-containing protein n=1 Tax=Vigna angularis var. angularis TaxID=157739 RepID=A0A0S3RT76_PHAAN|nr:hypothetical protein VIGAN_04094800 [Vigna angularis var. angularis]
MMVRVRDKIPVVRSFPLMSLANECAKCHGLKIGKAVDDDDDDVGNYFMLAMVFPASKVSKDGVCLSSNLYYTMGCPPMGSSVFVCAVQKQLLPTPASGSNQQHYMENSCLPINNCKELYLQLVPSNSGLPLKFNNFPSLDVSKVKSHVQFENDIVASPATSSSHLLLYQSFLMLVVCLLHNLRIQHLVCQIRRVNH